MRQTPVNDYLEEISTELPEELYGNLSDAVYETVCDFDEEVAQLKAENAKLRELVRDMAECMDNSQPRCKKCKFRELNCQWFKFDDRMRELGVEVDE